MDQARRADVRLKDDFSAGKLSAVRLGQKLTLRELARRSSVSHSQLSKIERGVCKPLEPTANAIAAGLGVEVSDLLDSNAERAA